MPKSLLWGGSGSRPQRIHRAYLLMALGSRHIQSFLGFLKMGNPKAYEIRQFIYHICQLNMMKSPPLFACPLAGPNQGDMGLVEEILQEVTETTDKLRNDIRFQNMWGREFVDNTTPQAQVARDPFVLLRPYSRKPGVNANSFQAIESLKEMENRYRTYSTNIEATWARKQLKIPDGQLATYEQYCLIKRNLLSNSKFLQETVRDLSMPMAVGLPSNLARVELLHRHFDLKHPFVHAWQVASRNRWIDIITTYAPAARFIAMAWGCYIGKQNISGLEQWATIITKQNSRALHAMRAIVNLIANGKINLIAMHYSAAQRTDEIASTRVVANSHPITPKALDYRDAPLLEMRVEAPIPDAARYVDVCSTARMNKFGIIRTEIMLGADAVGVPSLSTSYIDIERLGDQGFTFFSPYFVGSKPDDVLRFKSRFGTHAYVFRLNKSKDGDMPFHPLDIVYATVGDYTINHTLSDVWKARLDHKGPEASKALARAFIKKTNPLESPKKDYGSVSREIVMREKRVLTDEEKSINDYVCACLDDNLLHLDHALLTSYENGVAYGIGILIAGILWRLVEGGVSSFVTTKPAVQAFKASVTNLFINLSNEGYNVTSDDLEKLNAILGLNQIIIKSKGRTPTRYIGERMV